MIATNDFLKTKLIEIKIFDSNKIKVGTKIKYYERTMYEDIDEEWSWSDIGSGEIIDIFNDEIHFSAGEYSFWLKIDDFLHGFHKIEILE